MTIPTLTTANTFQELMNDVQQLIQLVNLMSDGPQYNANTTLVLSTLRVANLILTGGVIANVNTSIVPEGGANLYLTAARVRANVSNTTPITYDQPNGKFGHANSGVTPSGYGTSSAVPVIVVDQWGHIVSASNTNINFALARQQLANTTPINYDSVSGTISHSTSGATATGYGDSINVASFVINSTGHITSATNVAIRGATVSQPGVVQLSDVLTSTSLTQPPTANVANTLNNQILKNINDIAAASANANVNSVYKNHIFISARKGLNFLSGSSNLSISIVDDAANNFANITLDSIAGGGVNPSGFVTEKLNNSIISANSNTINYFQGAGVNVTMFYDAAGAGQVLVGIHANGIYDQANSAATAANTNATATKIRANISNTAPINYDSSTGIVSHAVSGVTAKTYAAANIVPVIVVDDKGHITLVTNTAIDYTGARLVLSSGLFVNVNNQTGVIAHEASGAAAGFFGDTTKTIKIQTDVTGHILSVANSNIDYSPARLQLSGTSPISYDNSTGIISHVATAANATPTYGNSTFVPIIGFDSKGHISTISNTAIDYSGARAVLANTGPINYNAATGTFSHALSGITAKTYGDSISIPVLTVDDKGHVTAVTNTTLRLATTAQFGAVMLEDSIVSTSVANAATPNVVSTVYQTVVALAAALGTMSSQQANNVLISGGKATNIEINATRVVEGVAVYTPVANANVTLDWGIAGGSRVVCNGNNRIFLSNIVAGTMGHMAEFSNLNQMFFAANANTDFGVSTKPSINGKAVLNMFTMNTGANVYVGTLWRAV
jgi:hypothetical protein